MSTSKKENIPALCSNGRSEHNWDLWYPRPEMLREDGVFYVRECQQMGCEGVQHAANLIPAHEDEQQHLRQRDRARDGLKELLGFAERNLKRAQAAHLAALGVDQLECAKMEAREHEALRFYNVVREVAEARR